MRRLGAIAALVAGAAVVAALAGAGGGGDRARVDAIFDNTAALIPGQDVKVAGARVGTVKEIHLTPQRKARVQMEIDRRFVPFRGDARCIIRPQSLIGEKFIQCDPGTPNAGPLPRGEDGAPTVPLEQNSSPVDLDLVFGALRAPYRERLAILVNELGAGLAGRPAELSAAIRRANPALREANEVLRILDSDRRTLARLVGESDRVLRELAGRRRETASFIEHANAAATSAAAHRDELEQAVRRLPGLLDRLRPSAGSLAQLAGDARPVVRELRASAPSFRALLADLDPLSDAAAPALVKLSEMSRTGRRAVRAAGPVADLLQPVAERLPPLVRTTTELGRSLRESGSNEGLLGFLYYGATSTARFDRVSHILPSYQLSSSCQLYTTTPVEGCSARFAGARDAPGRTMSRRAAGRRLDRISGDRLLDYLMGP